MGKINSASQQTVSKRLRGRKNREKKSRIAARPLSTFLPHLLLGIVLVPFFLLPDPHLSVPGLDWKCLLETEVWLISGKRSVCSVKKGLDWQGQGNPESLGDHVHSISKFPPPFFFISLFPFAL